MNAAAAPRPGFPWEAVLSTGLGVLRLCPRDFWSMTPLEFAYAAGLIRRGGDTLNRDDLQALMARHPDG